MGFFPMHRSDCKPHQPKDYWKPFNPAKHTGYVLAIQEFQGINPGGGPLPVNSPIFYPVKFSQV